jgi:TetR/AcrR family transcriptional repressor of nem operon
MAISKIKMKWLLLLFKFNVKKLQDTFAREIEKHTTFKDKLLVYPRLYSDYYELRVTKGGCPIINTATEADDTHPVLRKKVENTILAWKDKLVYFIEQGILAGEFKAQNIDPEKTALTIIAIIEGAVMITKITGNLSNLSDIMLSLKKIINDLE